MSEDIFYKPHLQIPESYHTDGKPPRTTSPEVTPSSSTESTRTLTFLKDACKTTLKSLVTLPVPLRKPLETGLFTVQFLLTLIPEKEYENIDTPTVSPTIHVTEYDPHENENSKNKDIENVLSNIFGGQKVEYATKTSAERINYKYYVSLYNIMEDYIDKVKRSLVKYNTILFSQVGIENLDIVERRYIADYDTLTGLIGANDGNISDLLVRQNHTKNQKLRLLNKLCNERTSLTHIKSCELSRLLLLRYYGIAKNNIYLHDVALMEQIKTEEAKLDKKMEQLYKYLNTSVILLDECLTLHAHEAIAKHYLQTQAKDKLGEDVALFSVVKTEPEEESKEGSEESKEVSKEETKEEKSKSENKDDEKEKNE